MLVSRRISEEVTLCDGPGVPLSPKEMATVLGERLRSARKERGLGQKHLADASGKTQPYISQLEKGEILDPSAFIIRAIEERLQVYPNYLTEPPELAAAREAAINRIMEHGAELGIDKEVERELRLRLSIVSPGPNPPLSYMFKLVDLAKALLAAEKGAKQP